MRRKRWMVMMLFFYNKQVVLNALRRSLYLVRRKKNIYLQNYEQFAVTLPSLMRVRKPKANNPQL